jgi:hypothetical protein
VIKKMTDKCETCGHVRESHNQTVVIKGEEHQNTCKSCTCIKFISKEFIDAIRASSQERDDDSSERSKMQVMKYVKEGSLFEVILLAGLPSFVRYKDDKIEFFKQIEESSRTLVPFTEQEPAPYAFTNVAELEQYIELAKQKTYDSLYMTAKKLVSKYCDIDETYKVIFAADLVFSYLQDKIGMTHYLFAHGLPGTGKGAMLELAHQVAYRAVLFASARAASIYRTLGTVEPGQACLLIDEANNLEENIDLQEVLKTGYKLNGKVPRVLDASSSTHTAPTYFCTFGWKMIAAEKLPNEFLAAGFLSRTFKLRTFYGKPEQKIDKVVSQHDKNKKLQPLYEELVRLRKTLFAFRLLHFDDELADVKLNIDGRPEELCLPLVQIFKDTEAMSEILAALSKLVIESQSEKADGFDAYLYARMKEMLDASETLEFENAIIWNTLKELLKGEDVVDKPHMMRTAQFGDISKARITQTLKKFGAKASRDSTGDKRVLKFDKERFDKFCAMFDVPEKIEILLSDTSDMSDTFQKQQEGTQDDIKEQNNKESIQADVNPSKTQIIRLEEFDKHVSQKGLDTPGKVSDMSEVSERFVCPLCNSECKTYDELERHAVQKHPGKAVIAEWSMKHKQVELGRGLGKPVGETAAEEGGNRV